MNVGTKAPTSLQASIITTKHMHPELTTREIAKLNDTVHSHVVRTLNEYGIDTERTERYKCTRADILAGIQERVLRTKYGTDEALKKMPDAAAILLFNSTYNAERLERGQATEISVNFDAIKAMEARRLEIAERIKALEERDSAIEAETYVASPKERHDNDAPCHIINDNNMLRADAMTDKIHYVNYEGQGRAQQGTRRGRPRKGR